jgi:peptide/nickel transport system permease protein
MSETVAVLKKSKSKKNSQIAMAWRRFRRNKLAMAGLLIIIVIFIIAVFAKFVAPYPFEEQHLKDSLKGPSLKYLFGTDQYGRDILSRVIYGSRVSLMVGIFSVTLAATLGCIIGAIAGYFGGAIDNILMRIIDIILSIPAMLLAISISAMLGPGLFNAMISISVTGVGSFARITRSSVLSERDQEYIEAVRSVSCGNLRIIFRHIFPNILAPIIVQFSLNVASSILAAAGLSFIGLGIQPPIPEWGAMLSAGRSFIRYNWWLTVFPGISIMLTVYGFNLIGDGLRDALDPRLKN